MFPAVYGILSQSGALWTPAQPTTGGGVLPHTWHVPGVSNFQDVAKTTPAGVGNVVGAVVNQGSDTHDIVQATTNNKPTLQQVTINSVTSYVWRLDGTNDYLQGTFGGGAISQPFTMFVVAKLDATVINDDVIRYLIDSTGVGRVLLDKSPSTSPDSWIVNAGASLPGGDADANFNIWTPLFNGASGQLWFNGVSKSSGNIGANSMDNIIVGNRNSLIGPTWKGDIGPILIYPGNLSTADKNQIGAYLERVTGIVWTTIT